MKNKIYYGQGTHCSIDPEGDVIEVEEDEEEYDHKSIEDVFLHGDGMQQSMVAESIARGDIPIPDIYTEVYGVKDRFEYLCDLHNIQNEKYSETINDNNPETIKEQTSEILQNLETER